MEQENTEVSQCSTNADQEILADSVSADPEISADAKVDSLVAKQVVEEKIVGRTTSVEQNLQAHPCHDHCHGSLDQ